MKFALAILILLFTLPAIAEQQLADQGDGETSGYTEYNIAREMPFCCGGWGANDWICCWKWFEDNWGPFPPDIQEEDHNLSWMTVTIPYRGDDD